MLVGQDHQAREDILGGDRRQGEPLEAVQSLHGVGQVGIGIDDGALGPLEGEARLSQPPQPDGPRGHFGRQDFLAERNHHDTSTGN